jgi:hypothetical protein
VDQLPASSDFHLGTPGRNPPTLGGTDSAEAVRFKDSLRNLYAVDAAERSIPIPVRRPIELASIAAVMLENLQPEQTTIPRHVLGTLTIPERIRKELTESFGEVMVYPEIDQPMYEPLKAISTELFLPNIQLIPNNSVTLLETNRKFMESYMVGLNHEFARELLWREYPTDQRGSYFRQFWDVRGFLAEATGDPEALRERLRDIPELHKWSKASALGKHDHRKPPDEKEEKEDLVLVIRGELLKKYPTAVIYPSRSSGSSGRELSQTGQRPFTSAGMSGRPGEPLSPARGKLREAILAAQSKQSAGFGGCFVGSQEAIT